MTHIALWEVDAQGKPSATWGEHVSDEEYQRGPAAR
jgi:hypothetical protein